MRFDQGQQYRVSWRALPRMLPEAGALGASEFFATWAGPIGWAVPISLGIRDALVAATGAARARGEDRGNCNQFAAAFVRESYGFSHPAYSGSNRAPAQRGISGARALAARHGWVQVQRRLERDFNSGLPPRSSISQAGHFLASDLEVMWSRMGEAIFASHEGGEMPRAMQRF